MMFCDANLFMKIKNNIVKLPFRGENAMSMRFKEPLMCIANAEKFVISDLCDAHRNDALGSFRVLPPVFKDFGTSQNFSGSVVTAGCIGLSGRLA